MAKLNFVIFLMNALVLCATVIQISSAVEYIRIGGLFDDPDEMQEKAFEFTIQSINNERSLWPDKVLAGISKKMTKGDSFATSLEVCDMLGQGTIGIFGPVSGKTSRHVQSICEAKDVPHIEMRVDPTQSRGNCHINFHPHPSSLAKAYLDIIRAYEWKAFTILYENSDSFARLGEVLKMYDDKGHTITLRQLDEISTTDYRPILKRVKRTNEKNLLIDVSIDKLYEVLIQAQQVGLMSDQHNYIITNLDMHTINMDPFKHGGTNITGIRLVDPENQLVVDAIREWNTLAKQRDPNIETEMTPSDLKVDTALIADSVNAFAQVLKELNFSKYTDNVFDCEEDYSWDHGSTVTNFMKAKQLKGLTGDIKFDYEGFRTDFQLDIVELAEGDITKIGTWDPSGIKLVRLKPEISTINDETSLANRTFRVLTAISDPYGMLKDSTIKLEGNDRYEGFGIELIDELSKMLGFNYTFSIQEDGNYGSLNRETKEWNGMIKELRENRADLAITDLTVTSERESGVDFTMPFMNLGISILYKRPTKQPPSLFSFMSPFSNEVWLYLGTAYLGVSILIFVYARISPKEWQNPYPCIQEPDQLENQFSMANSLWFTVGSVLQQGSELAPIAISTRMMAGIWWFFTLIMVSSYTANLAAFLTVESLQSPINNADELADNTQGIVYGAKAGGATFNFFRDAEIATYQKMYQYMKNHPAAMTASNAEGVKRAQTENYAFLMESTSIEYITERKCDLTQIGGLLDDKGYAIAMRKNSGYRNALSEAVLKLQEEGKLTSLKRKWWKEKRGGGACSSDSGDSGSKELGIPNVGGVFLVLICGGGAACLIAFGEMLFGVYQRSRSDKVPFRQELIEELKFVVKCSGDTKPVRHRASGSKSPDNLSQKSAGSKKSKKENEANGDA